MVPASQALSRKHRRIGKYVVTGRIGRGGMGMVYRGYDEVLEREVAVKTLTVEGTLDEEITWPFGLDDSISYDGNRLKTAIKFANRKVLEATKESTEYEGMATTVAAVLVDSDKANVGHVGDSRVYLWRADALSQLTSDHSWVNEQLQSGVLSAEQARTHPLRNVVTRALGGKNDLQVDIQCQEMLASDILLICSDGLTTMVPDEDIADVFREAKGDLDKTAQGLVDEANSRGGEDNITVLLIQFLE